MQQIYEQLVKGIKEYFAVSGLTRAVLGISGGLDSALTLKLAVDALGPEKVTAISMPERGISHPLNADHAKKLCTALGAEFYNVPLNQFVASFGHLPWGTNPLAGQNVRARIRMVLLYHFANCNNALVLGTSNKSELMLGYGTKYGDLAADLEVLGDIFKEEVVSLSDFVGLPPEIIAKPPSAELYEGQTDAADLGATYNELDPILKKMAMGKEGLIERGISAALVHNVFSRIEKNKHKTEMPPIIKIARA